MGDKTPGTTTMATSNLKGCGRNYKEELPLGEETLGTKEELPLGDETPGTTTTTTPNLQGCGRTTKTKITATRFMDTESIMYTSRIMATARTMVIKYHGHRKDHVHNDKENYKEDAQPPRVRRMKQASPMECIFYVLTNQPQHRTRAK